MTDRRRRYVPTGYPSLRGASIAPRYVIIIFQGNAATPCVLTSTLQCTQVVPVLVTLDADVFPFARFLTVILHTPCQPQARAGDPSSPSRPRS